MTAWQSGDVEANGIRLHYITDDGLCWTPAYNVVMVDARGHGQSDAPEQGYDSAT